MSPANEGAGHAGAGGHRSSSPIDSPVDSRSQRPGRSEAAPASEKNLQHVVAGDLAGVALVPADGVFEGQVSIQGDTRIEGLVRGSLRGTGRLELGPQARIEGNVDCEELCSEGAIVGPVEAHQRVELGPGARLDGDLRTPKLKVADSAILNGSAKVGS